MNFSLDAEDMKLAKRAVDACASDDPLALALGMLTHMDKKHPLAQCQENREKASRVKWLPQPPNEALSLEQVDRTAFGIAMCSIFQARIMARCFTVRSFDEANSRSHKQAFEDAVKLISSVKVYLDPRQWLTYQFELGYSHLDVGATREAKLWLETFLKTLDAVKEMDGSLTRHWTRMRNSAETKLSLSFMMANSTM